MACHLSPVQKDARRGRTINAWLGVEMHPTQAREAIDSQIATSDCVSKLPAENLGPFCKLELPQISPGGCNPQLAHIGRAAQLQAVLVHLQLGMSLATDSNSMQEKSGSSVRTIAANSRAPAPNDRSYVSSNPGVRTAPRPVHRARSAEAALTHGEGPTPAWAPIPDNKHLRA